MEKPIDDTSKEMETETVEATILNHIRRSSLINFDKIELSDKIKSAQKAQGITFGSDENSQEYMEYVMSQSIQNFTKNTINSDDNDTINSGRSNKKRKNSGK